MGIQHDWLGPGGPERAARILNLLPRAEREQALAEIGEQSPELAEQIRSRMFVFEDLCRIPDRDFARLFSGCERDQWVKALRGASPALSDKIEQSLGARRAAMVREDVDALGPVRAAEVLQARAEILKTARRLGDGGEIRLGLDPAEKWIE